jgi:hypothetical protein
MTEHPVIQGVTEVANSSRYVAIETPQVMLNYAS